MKMMQGSLQGKGMRVGIVVSRFNGEITDNLLKGALDELKRMGAEEGQIDVVRVPGAFEVPFGLSLLGELDSYDALIALGCVIRGETPHFDYVCEHAARGCMDMSLDFGVPIGFGILTVDTMEQAKLRSHPEGGNAEDQKQEGAPSNKGAEAARVAVELANLREEHF